MTRFMHASPATEQPRHSLRRRLSRGRSVVAEHVTNAFRDIRVTLIMADVADDALDAAQAFVVPTLTSVNHLVVTGVPWSRQVARAVCAALSADEELLDVHGVVQDIPLIQLQCLLTAPAGAAALSRDDFRVVLSRLIALR